ncbi:hypothetical protein ABZU32_29225 [Sphaerisporangium sp. NPDC005288]|uniref:cupin domain-containing protein n=1 Tax=Sphaerisporangium sp. NPDC005288 TaxID=3155114 RepID=UPI0033A52DFE
MAIKEFRTEDLAPEDRFPSWFEMASSTHVPSWIRSDSEADFEASVRVLDCAGVQISALTHPTVRAERTARLIRQCDPEVYLFQFMVRGGGGLTQNGRNAVFDANHFVIIDSSQPYQGWRSAENGVNEAVVVQVSRASLGLRSALVERLAAAPFSAKEGIGAVLAGHLTELVKNAGDYTRADTVALGAVTVDLIAAACAHQVDATDRLSPEARQRALLALIHRFIHDRLVSLRLPKRGPRAPGSAAFAPLRTPPPHDGPASGFGI